jgi:CRP/FNR family cyclic AMP-dependent transcriptional regulator
MNLVSMFPIFQNFEPNQLTWVVEHMHQRFFDADQYILLSDQPGEAVYFVVSGALKVQVDQMEGADIVLALLGPGSIVGEMSLLDHGSGRSANVVPVMPANLLWMDRRTFQVIMQRIPAMNVNLIRLLAGRLRRANEQIRAVATLDVQGRVARQLLLVAHEFGVELAADDMVIPLRLTQSDLAALVGASRERVNQALGRLKRQKSLAIDADGQFHIHDLSALAAHCVGYLPDEIVLLVDGGQASQLDLPPASTGGGQSWPMSTRSASSGPSTHPTKDGSGVNLASALLGESNTRTRYGADGLSVSSQVSGLHAKPWMGDK